MAAVRTSVLFPPANQLARCNFVDRELISSSIAKEQDDGDDDIHWSERDDREMNSFSFSA